MANKNKPKLSESDKFFTDYCKKKCKAVWLCCGRSIHICMEKDPVKQEKMRKAFNKPTRDKAEKFIKEILFDN